MLVPPIVRYMILCNDWETDVKNQNRINIFGLLSHIFPVDTPAYPLVQRKICVFLALTEVRGVGKVRIKCVFEETGQLAFQTAEMEIRGGADPLAIEAVSFRILGCTFPIPGMYSIQFWYNEAMVHECPLHLRRPK